jgi:carbonic anhydrase
MFQPQGVRRAATEYIAGCSARLNRLFAPASGCYQENVTSAITDELLRNARGYASSFTASPGSGKPVLRVAVVACMDARVDPRGLLGLHDGDAHVIRNAGGVVTPDVIRSLTISQRLLGTTGIVLVQHTRCGMMSFTDEEFRARLRAEAGAEPDWDPGAFASLERSVRDGAAQLAASPFIAAKDSIRGFVFDVDTGALTEIPLIPGRVNPGRRK